MLAEAILGLIPVDHKGKGLLLIKFPDGSNLKAIEVMVRSLNWISQKTDLFPLAYKGDIDFTLVTADHLTKLRELGRICLPHTTLAEKGTANERSSESDSKSGADLAE